MAETIRIRASTKAVKRGPAFRAAYRGVLRDEQNRVVWECDHTHESRSWTGYAMVGLFMRSALDCAEEAMRAAARLQAASQASTDGGGEDR